MDLVPSSLVEGLVTAPHPASLETRSLPSTTQRTPQLEKWGCGLILEVRDPTALGQIFFS